MTRPPGQEPAEGPGLWRRKQRQGPDLGTGLHHPHPGPQHCLPGHPSPESRGCTKAGPLGPSEVKPKATELVGPYEVTVPAWLDAELVPRGSVCPPADCT